MTLIAALITPISGMLIADMMVSSENESPSRLVLPTMTLEADRSDYTSHIVGMTNKAIVVSEHLAIACAGSEHMCLSVMFQVAKEFPDKNFAGS